MKMEKVFLPESYRQVPGCVFANLLYNREICAHLCHMASKCLIKKQFSHEGDGNGKSSNNGEKRK